jgi:hypothetical protein
LITSIPEAGICHCEVFFFCKKLLLVEIAREESLWWYSRALVRTVVIDHPTPSEDRALRGKMTCTLGYLDTLTCTKSSASPEQRGIEGVHKLHDGQVAGAPDWCGESFRHFRKPSPRASTLAGPADIQHIVPAVHPLDESHVCWLTMHKTLSAGIRHCHRMMEGSSNHCWDFGGQG